MYVAGVGGKLRNGYDALRFLRVRGDAKEFSCKPCKLRRQSNGSDELRRPCYKLFFRPVDPLQRRAHWHAYFWLGWLRTCTARATW